ncbi:type II secretion system GspH family protein [bacterium]|nr:type II secretion system GspH family protein [bacterium]
MNMFEKRRKADRSGFTLIELVMVVMILAIVAGLAVPIVGWVRRSANYAAQANTQQAVASNLEFYRTTYGNNAYPQHLDSLLLANGGDDPTATIAAATTFGNDGIGGTIALKELSGDQTQSIKAIGHVYDHTDDATAWLQGNPGNSGLVERELTAAGPNVYAVIDQTSGNGQALMREWYGIDSDEWPATTEVEHVCFGIGPNCDLVGATMQSAPMDPRVDASSQYNRFVAVFAVYNPRSGQRAQLRGVINAKGRSANNALSEFWQSTNPE